VYLHLRVIKSSLIWTSLCILIEVDPIELHYMTDSHERFDLSHKYHIFTYILDALEVS